MAPKILLTVCLYTMSWLSSKNLKKREIFSSYLFADRIFLLFIPNKCELWVKRRKTVSKNNLLIIVCNTKYWLGGQGRRVAAAAVRAAGGRCSKIKNLQLRHQSTADAPTKGENMFLIHRRQLRLQSEYVNVRHSATFPCSAGPGGTE